MVERKLVVAEHVVAAELDDEAVLLNVESGVYFGLDTVGAEIWKLLEAGATEAEICAWLLSEYEAGVEQVTEDVRAFLATLAAKGLIR